MDWGQPGLWMVDRAGQSTQLWKRRDNRHPALVSETVRKFYFVESDATSEEVTFVHVATGLKWARETAPDIADIIRAVSLVTRGTDLIDSTLSAGEQVSLQRALGRAAKRIDSIQPDELRRASGGPAQGKGRAKGRGADVRSSPQTPQETRHLQGQVASRTWRRWREQQLRPKTASNERVCVEHMLVLNDLARGYAEKYDAPPTDHGTLQGWAKHKAEMQAYQRRGAAERRGSPRAFSSACPAIPESDPQVKYLYRPQAAPGMPVLACFWHRDRYLHLTETAGDRRLEAVDMRGETVDSLFAVVLQHTREDRLKEAGGPFPACGRPTAEGCAPPH